MFQPNWTELAKVKQVKLHWCKQNINLIWTWKLLDYHKNLNKNGTWTFFMHQKFIFIILSATWNLKLLITEQFCIDSLRLFWFSRKIVHAHISGRQNKNKLKEKHAESSELLVNRDLTSIYTSFVFGFWEKYARQLHSIQMYKLKVSYFFIIL